MDENVGEAMAKSLLDKLGWGDAKAREVMSEQSLLFLQEGSKSKNSKTRCVQKRGWRPPREGRECEGLQGSTRVEFWIGQVESPSPT